MNNWKQYIFFIDFFYDSWVSGDLFFLKSYSRETINLSTTESKVFLFQRVLIQSKRV